MSRLSLTALVLILFSGQTEAQQLSRTRLSYEQDRDSFVAWHRDGTLDLMWTIGGKGAQPYPLSETEEWWESGYHGAVTLPEGLAPGKHRLDCGNGHAADIEIVVPPKRKQKRIPANDNSRANVVKAFKDGFLEIILEPGEHVWPEMVIVPEWAIIRGYHATVRHGYKVNYGENWPLIYLGGRNVSVYGVTFQHDRRGQVFISLTDDAHNPTGLVVGDCTFCRCNFGFFMRDAYVRHCRFESAGAVIAPGGLWFANTFTGPPTQHAFSYWSNSGPLAMFDSTLTGTDRGIVFNTWWGPQTGHLFVGTKHRNIRRTSANAGECHTFEGPGPFSDHLFLHDDYASCSGPLYQWGGNADGTARNNLIIDVRADEGQGVIWWGHQVEDNEITLAKFRGCGLYLGPGAKRNRITRSRFINWLPDPGNQPADHPSPLCASRTCCLIAEGPDSMTNVLTDVQVIALSPGFTSESGFGRVR